MYCENRFCALWANSCCTLEEISLDARGCCDYYVPVGLEEAVLRPGREQDRQLLSDIAWYRAPSA